MDSIKLKKWFLEKKRDLPWRHTRDPYAIWISEIMLQQTQVAVVIPYFLRWMNQFPTIRHLAAASLDVVIKAWEGLGYYSRVRHLHEAAHYLVKNFEGKLPDQEEELKKIKGLGPYTRGALLSFAFHQKKAAVDGNVIRVLSRYCAIQEDIAKPAVLRQFQKLAEDLLPDEEPWIFNEALIELGATICQRNARCPICPLRSSCQGFQRGLVQELPYKSKKQTVIRLYRSVAVIQCDSAFLVVRGKKGGIMSDLYEFPYFEAESDGLSSNVLQEKMKQEYDLNLVLKKKLKEVTHGFTRYRVNLYPLWFIALKRKDVEGFDWLTYEALTKLAFSSGHRRIFQQL